MSEQITRDVMCLLVERGYFHQGLDAPLEDVKHEESAAAMKRTKELKPDPYTETDESCQLVVTLDGYYVTRSRLQTDLLHEVQSSGGRLSFRDAATALAVTVENVKHAASVLALERNVKVIEGQFITQEYLDDLTANVATQLTLDSHLRVSQLADNASLPSNVMLRLLTDRLGGKPIHGQIVTIGGVKELVSPVFEELLQTRVHGALLSFTVPTPVESVCHEFGWDMSMVLPIVRDLCNTSTIPGELHETVSSSSGAMYVPSIYQELQRKTVDGFYSVNGFITAEKTLSMGIPSSKMGDYVKESFPSAVVLSGSVINTDVVTSPLEIAITESVTEMSFVDLKLHLPADFPITNDVAEIVNDIVLPKIKSQESLKSKKLSHLCLVVDEEALFFSAGMIQKITNELVPPLVEAYGKSHAEEIDKVMEEESSKTKTKRSTSVGSEDEGTKIRGKAKGRRKGKKAAAAKKVKPTTEEEVDVGVVPLCSVAKEVAEAYPDLADIQESYGKLFEGGEEGAPVWEERGDLDGEDVTGGPLYEFCRVALYTSQLRESCARAVGAELERIKSIKEAVSVSSRKDGAAKVRNIEHAFEDSSCFPAACYLVQMLAKFVDYVSSLEVDDESVATSKADFLRGCGADFSKRVTEYCLFKNEIEDGLFIFRQTTPNSVGEQVDTASLPDFCQPVKTAIRSFPPVFLSCSPREDGVAPEPLPTIRKLLPGSVGVSLARMWTQCGGDCYDGGTRVSADGVEYTRPGDFDGFLKNVSESLLTICGLPFKKLDKKSEKQAMFARRQELTKALEAASDAEVVLEISVMLLFQQVKGFAVCGRHLSGSILTLLTKEKKVPGSASSLLNNLANCIRNESGVDNDLIESVRACGLSRDISKHEAKGS